MNDSTHNIPDDSDAEPLAMDPAITKKLFRQWRSPRFGSTNPERMNNPVWEWLVRSKATAYTINQQLKGPSVFKAGPGWCFQRYGQSHTSLPDGRIVMIGGEHEDSYDPDFFIYNDVVVRLPDGTIDIFGYPKDVFPPIDFHSATLAGEGIVLIGCLGYPDQRVAGKTPLFIVDLRTFAIKPIEASGESPGWIHEHTANLSADGSSILVQGGSIYKVANNIGSMPRNPDDWRLNLATYRWERLTDRQWQQWEVRRQDGEPVHLMQIQQLLLSRKAGMESILQEQMRKIYEQFGMPSLEEELGRNPDWDVAARLYQPDLAHEAINKSEYEYGVHRIEVSGVIVEYDEDPGGVHVTVKGPLPQPMIDSIIGDLQKKLATLENSPCTAMRL